MINEAKEDAFAKGIRTLCNVHFGNYAKKEQAHILGELLFNSRVIAKPYSNEANAKRTAYVASCVFNSVSCLMCIDSKVGSLNDSASRANGKIFINHRGEEGQDYIASSTSSDKRTERCKWIS